MKFAKELEQDLVPEWRIKYFNYKQGKKKIKAIQRAIQNAHRSPRTPLRRTLTPRNPIRDFLQVSPNKSNRGPDDEGISPTEANRTEDADQAGQSVEQTRRHSTSVASPTRPIAVPEPAHEQHSLTGEYGQDRRVSGSGTVWTRYGSIIASPASNVSSTPASRPATLNLPDPALDPASEDDSANARTESNRSNQPIVGSAPAQSESAYEAGKTRHPSRLSRSLATRHMRLLAPAKSQSSASRDIERPLLKSLFPSRQRVAQKGTKYTDVPLEAWKEIEARQKDFFDFLDQQMETIETFYKEKEAASTQRLKNLKEQLHAMADQRAAEINAAREAKQSHQHKKNDDEGDGAHDNNGFRAIPAHLRHIPHTMDVIYHPIKTAKQVRFGKEQTQTILASPQDVSHMNGGRDYTRKPETKEIKYLEAKRKLKAAFQEYYRGLELLKSYALLNRTAFRKINKKYDKGVHARPTMRYMTETVNNAWFVRSTVIDEHITAAEDLYARYFEKGSHKVAVGKLRKRTRSPGAFNTQVFLNGLFGATGAVLALEGLVWAADSFYSSEGVNQLLATRISYLLQVYAGYFLLLLLVLFFCVDCRIFSQAKVNYAFIFEFDTRHSLDWRQLSVFPCFFLFLMGLTMCLNFAPLIDAPAMFLWWPVLLISLTIIIFFLPLPIFYFESRKWFIYSCWRLLGAGIYPVEFRDFFLGDMFCSQTYSMGGIELFFCVYANNWNNPDQCNSSTSRLLGFLTTVPGIMRLLQCLRRYKDTRNVFPHLVNGGKYSFTILQYASLSVFRLSHSFENRAFFITCATINSVYCSIWDLVMDWSLMDPYAKHPFLRPHLAYKSPYVYYAAMIIDPILRFNWIFYAIPYFSDEIQHSALLGFLVSLSEVIRRGIWTLFRVENEHCTNVGRFRASRDVPLPYDLGSDTSADYVHGSSTPKSKRDDDDHVPDALMSTSSRQSDVETGAVNRSPATASGADLERSTTHDTAVSSLRRRQGQQGTPLTPAQSIRARVGTLLRGAHAQDFERRRKDGDVDTAHNSDDDDDEEDSDGEDEDAMQDEIAQDVGNQRSDGIQRVDTAHTSARARHVDDRNESRRERREERENAAQNRSDIQDAEEWLRRARTGDDV